MKKQKTEFTRMDAIRLVEYLEAANDKHELQVLVQAARAIRKRYMIEEPVKVAVSVALIQKVVGRHFQITVEQMKSESRIKEIRKARDVGYHVATLITLQSINGIGRMFNKDHTTVMHAMKKSKKLLAEDKDYAALIDDLVEKCWAAAIIEKREMERNVECLKQMQKMNSCPTKSSLMSVKQHS